MDLHAACAAESGAAGERDEYALGIDPRVDLVAPDLQKCGGLLEGKRMMMTMGPKKKK